MKGIEGFLILSAGLVVVPALLARVIVGGTWAQVGASLAIWLGLLFLVFFSPGSSSAGEKVGWFLIIGMLTTVFAVPIITLIQRIGGWALTKAL